MNVRVLGISSCFLFAAVLALACSSTSKRSGFGVGGDPASDGGQTGFATSDAGNGSACAINNTSAELDKDFDGDGIPLRYDCNECDPNTNEGALDVPGNGLDEDCSGTPDDEVFECDDPLPLVAKDPFDAAKAMGLCKKADPKGTGWGVVDAKWVRPDGTTLTNFDGVGILRKLGTNAPQAGKSMLALSSGSARDPSDPGYKKPISHNKGYTSGAPPGYPKESPACPKVKTGIPHDGVALELTIRVPTNAKSFTYQQNFFTSEYPNFICQEYNDFFVAMMNPPPAGLPDANIAFDQDKNPISVNNSLLEVCSAGTHGGKMFGCPLGPTTLASSGFEGHAATGWLTTTAPVEPGSEITLLFAIWDSGDGRYDSTVLIDDFKFSSEGGNGVGTLPSFPK